MPRISNLKITPEPLPVTATKFEFSFVDHNGKEREYKIKVKGNDKEAFAAFVFALLKAKKKNWIDWPTLHKFNVDWGEDAIQEEMALKVARRSLLIY